MPVVNGHHSDKTGERRWHAAGGLLVAPSSACCFYPSGATTIIGIVGLTFVTSGILSWVACFWSLPHRIPVRTAAAAGIAWINSVGNLGGYAGPLAIGWVRDHFQSSGVCSMRSRPARCSVP